WRKWEKQYRGSRHGCGGFEQDVGNLWRLHPDSCRFHGDQLNALRLVGLLLWPNYRVEQFEHGLAADEFGQFRCCQATILPESVRDMSRQPRNQRLETSTDGTFTYFVRSETRTSRVSPRFCSRTRNGILECQ